MALYVSHRSALRLYRSIAVPDDERRRLRVRPKAQDKESLKEFSRKALRDAAQESEADVHPVDVVVRNADARVRSKTLCCHVAGHAFPAGSFRQVAEGLYLASPELVFLQMACYLTKVDLAVLGYELCGRYRMCGSAYSFDVCVLRDAFGLVLGGIDDPSGFDSLHRHSDGFAPISRPLSSVSRLRRYLDRAEGAPGIGKAKWALNHVIDSSASPMESLLALRLVLPSSAGGYGLPHPAMNGRVAVAQRASNKYGQRYRVCDLLWRGERVAVEYDSDAYHASGQKIADDSARRSELMHAGYSVVSVTTRLFFDYASFDAQAHVLRKLLGRRERSQVRDLDRRKRALHHALTGGCVALSDNLCSAGRTANEVVCDGQYRSKCQ